MAKQQSMDNIVSAIQQRQARSLPPSLLDDDHDFSSHPAYQGVLQRAAESLQPSQNALVGFKNICFSPDGKQIAGVASIYGELNAAPATRLAIINVEDGATSMVAERPGSDTNPQWSPDGKTVAFLSEDKSGSQLFLLDIASGSVKKASDLNGTIDQIYWSQKGDSILMIVAGLGADVSGIQGGVAIQSDDDDANAWKPKKILGPPKDAYRNTYLYNLLSGSLKQVGPPTLNVWEAAWLSETSFVGICSELPGEEDWYHSSLREVSLVTGEVKEVFTTDVQMQWLTASPSGAHVALAVGIASDRGIFTGDLHILDVASGVTERISAVNVNVNLISWASDEVLVASGFPDGADMVLQYNIATGQVQELWRGVQESVSTEVVAEVSAVMNPDLQVAFVRQGWFSAPTLVIASTGGTREVKKFGAMELEEKLQQLGQAKSLTWKAPDGLEIYGYFIAPSTQGPHPTLMHIHGGPVWGWRPRYLAQDHMVLGLLEAGFAIFEPNPRGSWGRGQAFTKHVYNDMGGVDTHDYLTGLDSLVDAGEADPSRLGVFGNSYGGFMTSWLITQTDRFAAALSSCPVTEWVSEHLTSNLGIFCGDFLADDIHDPTGQYFTRSPLHHVRKVKTPTLGLCGGKDKNTPPSQAIMFHQALLYQGTKSAVLMYPNEGHGMRRFPAAFDVAARHVDWFKHYLM